MKRRPGRPRKSPVSDVPLRDKHARTDNRTVCQPQISSEYIRKHYQALLGLYVSSNFKPLRFMTDAEKQSRADKSWVVSIINGKIVY